MTSHQQFSKKRRPRLQGAGCFRCPFFTGVIFALQASTATKLPVGENWTSDGMITVSAMTVPTTLTTRERKPRTTALGKDPPPSSAYSLKL
jgi:hypothetical protein